MICRICSSAAIARRFRFERYDVLRCATCDVEFLDPQPDDATLAAIYTEDYFFARDGEEDRERHARLKAASARRTLDLLPPPAAGTRLLDVGCGTGDFLIEARARGYVVSGVEFSPSSAATAAARVDGTVVQGDLFSANFPTASFDVIANSDVIEHVRDPLAFAREMRRVLAPGGRAIVSTPATDSWSARLLGTRWMEYKVEHLFYFDRPSLIRTLNAGGFVTVTTAPNVKVLSLDYILAHFEKFRQPFDGRPLRRISALLPDALRHGPFPIVASGITAIAS
jgi:SAM-dependent methyltransferase